MIFVTGDTHGDFQRFSRKHLQYFHYNTHYPKSNDPAYAFDPKILEKQNSKSMK